MFWLFFAKVMTPVCIVYACGGWIRKYDFCEFSVSFLRLKALTQVQVNIAKKFIGYHPIVIICLTRAGFKKENAIVH